MVMVKTIKTVQLGFEGVKFNKPFITSVNNTLSIIFVVSCHFDFIGLPLIQK